MEESTNKTLTQPLNDRAKLVIVPTKGAISKTLSTLIIKSCQKALQSSSSSSSSIFTIALSGGSLPSFLKELSTAFDEANIDPQWEKWHVFLADERCVPSSHEDSNLGSIRKHFTSGVGIPPCQIYGIDESLLSGSSEDIAESYQENVVNKLLEQKKTHGGDGRIDCVLLGFGPDGHTCSLFPNHQLLKEQSLFVASIDDSPKPPPSRITLTLPFLNEYCRQIIFCGAGESKRPIIQAVFPNIIGNDGVIIEENSTLGAKVASMKLCDPAPYPCGMVRPKHDVDEDDSLIWLVDEAAAME